MKMDRSTEQLTEKQRQAIAIGDTLPAYGLDKARAPRAEIRKLWASDNIDDKGRAYFTSYTYGEYGAAVVITDKEAWEARATMDEEDQSRFDCWTEAAHQVQYTRWGRQGVEWQFFTAYWRLMAKWPNMEPELARDTVELMADFLRNATGLNAYIDTFVKYTNLKAVRLLKVDLTEARQALEALNAIGVPLTITDPKKLKAKPLPKWVKDRTQDPMWHFFALDAGATSMIVSLMRPGLELWGGDRPIWQTKT